MSEDPDIAAFAATVAPSRAEVVQQVMSEARATLARSRGHDEVRDHVAEPLDAAPEWRSRERPRTSRDRTTAAPASAPLPDAQVSTWEQERGAVFEALSALSDLCETLAERLTELRDAECARMAEESKAPLELPSLRQLRQ